MSTTIEVDGSQRMVQAMLTIPDTQLADGGVYMCTAGQDGRNATEPPETMAILCVTGTLVCACILGKRELALFLSSPVSKWKRRTEAIRSNFILMCCIISMNV